MLDAPRVVRDSDALTLLAAFFRSQGMLQEEISQKLKINQPKVSRLLQAAERQRWLAHQPLLSVPAEKLQAALLEHFGVPFIQDELRRRYPNSPPPRICVLDESDFFRQAAIYLVQMFRPAHRVGVMWGYTLHRIVHEMQQIGRPPQLDRAIQALAAPQTPAESDPPKEFIPLCGEPVFMIHAQQNDFSASRLAAQLERIYYGDVRETLDSPSMAGVPAYLSTRLFEPKDASKRKADRSDEAAALQAGFREVYAKLPGYHAIFIGDDKQPPLVDHVDSVITGIGVMESTDARRGPGAFLEERLRQDGLTKADLDALVYGDIGGWLIPRPGLTPAQLSEVDRLNSGWIGLTRQHLENCARRGMRNGLGVTVVAKGPEKVDLIEEIVRLGLVNHLVLDQANANGLLNKLNPPPHSLA